MNGPSLLVGRMPSATMDLAAVTPEDTLERAQTLMSRHNFCQLPVLSYPSTLHGAVSWRSIATARAMNKEGTVASATVSAETVRIDTELFTVLGKISDAGYVFVRGLNQMISGIVTTADIGMEFGELTGPFLMITDIELRLRQYLREIYPTPDELREASGRNRVDTPDDLDLGGVERAFRNPETWVRLGWAIEQQVFVEELKAIRGVRNTVMHFRPLSSDQRRQVGDFHSWLRRLDQ